MDFGRNYENGARGKRGVLGAAGAEAGKRLKMRFRGVKPALKRRE